MACAQTEIAQCSQPWNMDFGTHGGLICNSLMGGSWADRSPLHEAALQGRLLNLRTYISQGFNVNIITLDRVSPLHEACLGGHVACAKMLLESGANANMATIDGATPIFNACRSGSTACVRLLLEKCPAPYPVNPLSSPLHEAAKRGHRECLEILLAAGMDIDLEIPQLGTPLYAACAYKRLDCVERLLQMGANVNRGRGQDTALHAAAQTDSARLVELLTDYGADVRSRNADGKRPAQLAAANSTIERALRLREGPSLLSQLCRLSIRQSLGPARLHLVPGLNLPNQLTGFLLYR